MNATEIETYSQAVIAGLAMRGISSDGLQLLMATPKSRMARLLEGQANLSEREISKIEMLTGLTAGQLATSVIELGGGELTDLMASWAKLLPSRLETESAAKPTRTRKNTKVRSHLSKNGSKKSLPIKPERRRVGTTSTRALAVA